VIDDITRATLLVLWEVVSFEILLVVLLGATRDWCAAGASGGGELPLISPTR
jgi:hypothetical protein